MIILKICDGVAGASPVGTDLAIAQKQDPGGPLRCARAPLSLQLLDRGEVQGVL